MLGDELGPGLGQIKFRSAPSGICLPETELLQSSFKTEFSMGSLSWRYRRSLQRHRRFLRSYRRSLPRYRRSLRRSAVADAATPIVARLAKQHKTLLNIMKHVKHREPLVKHHEPLVKHHEPLVKHHEPLVKHH